jgi:hypothetical protein
MEERPPEGIAGKDVTPPPQGFDERKVLRSQVPVYEKRIESLRSTLVSLRATLREREAQLRTEEHPDERDVLNLDRLRQLIQQRQRSIDEDEEELARMKRRLGIKP